MRTTSRGVAGCLQRETEHVVAGPVAAVAQDFFHACVVLALDLPRPALDEERSAEGPGRLANVLRRTDAGTQGIGFQERPCQRLAGQGLVIGGRIEPDEHGRIAGDGHAACASNRPKA